MEQDNKTDLLFREKLYNTEVTPSPGAWESLNKQLNRPSSTKGWYYSLAASVALLLGILWFYGHQSVGDDAVLADLIDHPIVEECISIQVPKKSLVIKQSAASSQPEPTLPKTLESKTDVFIDIEDIEIISITRLQPKPLKVDMGVLTPLLEEQFQPNYDEVKIIYIAGGDDKKEEKGLSKLWSVAQNIKPGKVLADFREAKDNFFTRNEP